MLEFKPLGLEDIPRLRNYFSYNRARICDATLGTAMIWREMYHTEYALCEGDLYFKVGVPEMGETFPLPLGPGELRAKIGRIAEYCCRHNMPISFYPVPEEEMRQLMDEGIGRACVAVANRDGFDYLYRAEDLKYFKGRKLSGQRNHVNKFLKTYGNWSFRPFGQEDAPALKEFLDRYAAGRDKAAASFHEDLAKTREVLDHWEEYGFLGGMLTAEGQIVGFSINEIVGDTMFTHIEKAQRDFQGGYQMLVAQAAQQFAVDGVEFINREDDAGDLGLRSSKLSYHPVRLLEKYSITVEDPCGLEF